MVEETHFSGDLAAHPGGFFEESHPYAFVNASVPDRPRPPLTTVADFNSNLVYSPLSNMSGGPVIMIRPEDAIGSDTATPPELAVIPKSMSNHFLEPAQAFSGVSSNENLKYLPPGAFPSVPFTFEMPMESLLQHWPHGFIRANACRPLPQCLSNIHQTRLFLLHLHRGAYRLRYPSTLDSGKS